MKSICLALVCLLAFGVGVRAQEGPDDDYGPQPVGGPEAKARYEAHLAEYKDNPDMLVLPGLLADRKARRVELLTECTGLSTGETIEFLLIDKGSSHGYEALLWSHAKPSDVHRALEFIGLKPGEPMNPAALRFWATGDRVKVEVREKDDDQPVPIERLVFDNETEDTLPEEGFVFSGSMTLPAPGEQGATCYAADAYDPRSVASIYNEPTAVLDVPRQVDQGAVYGRQVVSPDAAFKHGHLLTVVMTPAAEDGRFAPRRLKLALEGGGETGGLRCRLTEEGKEEALAEGDAVAPMLEKLAAFKDDGAVPYLEVSCAPALPLQDVAKACTLVAMMEAMGMVRLEPPPAGQLYCRAFVPDRRWRDPAGRPSHPWELHLARADAKVVGRLVWQEPLGFDENMERRFKSHVFDGLDPDAVRSRLVADAEEREKAGKSPLPAVLLVFADAALTYGDVLAFVVPVRDTHGTVYVFVERDERDADRTPEE